MLGLSLLKNFILPQIAIKKLLSYLLIIIITILITYKVVIKTVAPADELFLNNNDNFGSFSNGINTSLVDSRPNDYIYALMSSHVYQVDLLKEKLGILPGYPNWIIKVIKSSKSGYFGVIYFNQSENHIVVAHRGTDLGSKRLISTIITDLNGVILNNFTKQHEDSLELVNIAVELAKTTSSGLSFTGHSLGGFLAELSVFHCNKALNFLNVNAVTFDSPGAQESIKVLMQSNDENNRVDTTKLDIIGYLSHPPNLINTWNHHIGTLYSLEVSLENKQPVIYKWLPVFLHYMFNIKKMHSVDVILNTFNKQARPKMLNCLSDWPLAKQLIYFFNAIPLIEQKPIISQFYQAHVVRNNYLSNSHSLYLKHFNVGTQNFLKAFYGLRESKIYSATELEERLHVVQISSDLIQHLLTYNIYDNCNMPYVVLSTDEDIIQFRRNLSIMLEQHADFIKELLKYSQKSNQQHKIYYKSKLDWHIAAANKKCQYANVEQYYLAQAYENGDVSLGIDTPNKAQAFYWYETAAKNNYCNAQIRLAQAYEYGNILDLKKDLSEALFWYVAAASEKCQDAHVAQFRLARAYEDGELLVNGIIDHKKALLYYLKAAHNDHYDAQHYLAILYKFGDRLAINKDPYKSLYWYMRAADNGFDKANIAEYELGQSFRYGDDWLNIELDLEEALYWYKRAINRSVKYDEPHIEALKAFNDLSKHGYKPCNKSRLRLKIKEKLIDKFN